MKILLTLAFTLLIASRTLAQMPTFPHFQSDSIGDYNLKTRLNDWPVIRDADGIGTVTWKPTDLLEGYTPEMSNSDLRLYLLYCYDAITYASTLPPSEARTVIQTIEQESARKFWSGCKFGHGYAGTLFFKYPKDGYYKQCVKNPSVWYSSEMMAPFIIQAKQLKQSLLEARGAEMESFFRECQQYIASGETELSERLSLVKNSSNRGLFGSIVEYYILANMTAAAPAPSWYTSGGSISQPVRATPTVVPSSRKR